MLKKTVKQSNDNKPITNAIFSSAKIFVSVTVICIMLVTGYSMAQEIEAETPEQSEIENAIDKWISEQPDPLEAYTDLLDNSVAEMEAFIADVLGLADLGDSLSDDLMNQIMAYIGTDFLEDVLGLSFDDILGFTADEINELIATATGLDIAGLFGDDLGEMILGNGTDVGEAELQQAEDMLFSLDLEYIDDHENNPVVNYVKEKSGIDGALSEAVSNEIENDGNAGSNSDNTDVEMPDPVACSQLEDAIKRQLGIDYADNLPGNVNLNSVSIRLDYNMVDDFTEYCPGHTTVGNIQTPDVISGYNDQEMASYINSLGIEGVNADLNDSDFPALADTMRANATRILLGCDVASGNPSSADIFMNPSSYPSDVVSSAVVDYSLTMLGATGCDSNCVTESDPQILLDMINEAGIQDGIIMPINEFSDNLGLVIASVIAQDIAKDTSINDVSTSISPCSPSGSIDLPSELANAGYPNLSATDISRIQKRADGQTAYNLLKQMGYSDNDISSMSTSEFSSILSSIGYGFESGEFDTLQEAKNIVSGQYDDAENAVNNLKNQGFDYDDISGYNTVAEIEAATGVDIPGGVSVTDIKDQMIMNDINVPQSFDLPKNPETRKELTTEEILNNSGLDQFTGDDAQENFEDFCEQYTQVSDYENAIAENYGQSPSTIAQDTSLSDSTRATLAVDALTIEGYMDGNNGLVKYGLEQVAQDMTDAEINAALNEMGISGVNPSDVREAARQREIQNAVSHDMQLLPTEAMSMVNEDPAGFAQSIVDIGVEYANDMIDTIVDMFNFQGTLFGLTSGNYPNDITLPFLGVCENGNLEEFQEMLANYLKSDDGDDGDLGEFEDGVADGTGDIQGLLPDGGTTDAPFSTWSKPSNCSPAGVDLSVCDSANIDEWRMGITSNYVKALMAMTQQFSTVMAQQAQIVGTFFDAQIHMNDDKWLQNKRGDAFKEFQPGMQMCHFATFAQDFPALMEKEKINTRTLNRYFLDRQRGNVKGDELAKGTGSPGGMRQDYATRLRQFKTYYCNEEYNGIHRFPAEFGCVGETDRIDNDINYTRIDSQETLDIDFQDGETSDAETDILEMGKYLFSHNVFSNVPDKFFYNENAVLERNKVRDTAYYLSDMRSLIALRAPLIDSYSQIMALKGKGTSIARDNMKSYLEDMGLDEDTLIEILGEDPEDPDDKSGPSEQAMLDIMMSKMTQNPDFYTGMYDTPANVRRNRVALQAIENMAGNKELQSALRMEMLLSIKLETRLRKYQDKLNEDIQSNLSVVSY